MELHRVIMRVRDVPAWDVAAIVVYALLRTYTAAFGRKQGEVRPLAQ